MSYVRAAACQPRTKARVRAAVEGLENRLLLTTWYVSTRGSDANPGTARQPFQTIQQAANMAQPGDTVLIRAGTYYETVAPPHSGTAGAPITFEAMPGQKVIIDGADPINQWANGSNGASQVTLSWNLGEGNNQVFYLGQPLAEAQWPNRGAGNASLWQPPYAQFAAVTADNGTEGATSATATVSVPQLTEPAGTWVGATIEFAAGQQWVFQTGTVTASSPGSLTFSYTPLAPYEFQALTVGNPFYLTGTAQALDARGEWFIDPATNTLSLLSPTGGTPRAGAVQVKHRAYGFDLSGVSYVNIVGVKLFACTINTDANSTYDAISGIAAQYVSQSLDKPDPWADKFAPHTSGIIVNGSNNTIENSTIQYSTGDGVFLGGSGNTVQNCVIADADTIGADEAGITTLGSNEQVLNNTVYDCGRDGIAIRYSPGSTIAHNRVYDCGLLTTDAGGIYTYETDGQGTTIEYNQISGIHTAGFGGTGIYLDNGSSDYVVDHNVVWNVETAIKMNPPSDSNQVSANTFSGTNSISGNGTSDMTGSTLANNIFIGTAQIGTEATQSDNLFDPPTSVFVSARTGNFQLRRAQWIRATVPKDGTAASAAEVGAYALGQPPFRTGATLRLLRAGVPFVR